MGNRPAGNRLLGVPSAQFPRALPDRTPHTIMISSIQLKCKLLARTPIQRLSSYSSTRERYRTRAAPRWLAHGGSSHSRPMRAVARHTLSIPCRAAPQRTPARLSRPQGVVSSVRGGGGGEEAARCGGARRSWR